MQTHARVYVLDDLAGQVVAQIEHAKYKPTRILALARGGFNVAAVLAKKLNILGDNLVGVSVEEYAPGKYRIAAWFVELMPVICARQTLLVVDDSSISGMLANGIAHDCVMLYGAGDARSCVAIASATGRPSDFVGVTCEGKPPKFQ